MPGVMSRTATNVRDSYTRKSNNKFHTDRSIRKLQPTFSPENIVRTIAFHSGELEGHAAFPIR